MIIPAIDLKEGRCVRLQQGDMARETVYGEDPAAMARHWWDVGARRLHIVDLDGAVAGNRANAGAIMAIRKACPDMVLQVGGGIREDADIAFYKDVGIEHIIIGSRAVSKPDWVLQMAADYPDSIMIGVDAWADKVAVEGWQTASMHTVDEVLAPFKAAAIAGVIYTDIARDGMLSGVNRERTWALAARCPFPVIASGGVKDMADVKALFTDNPTNLVAAISGKALYDGRLDFAEAKAWFAAKSAP